MTRAVVRDAVEGIADEERVLDHNVLRTLDGNHAGVFETRETVAVFRGVVIGDGDARPRIGEVRVFFGKGNEVLFGTPIAGVIGIGHHKPVCRQGLDRNLRSHLSLRPVGREREDRAAEKRLPAEVAQTLSEVDRKYGMRGERVLGETDHQLPRGGCRPVDSGIGDEIPRFVCHGDAVQHLVGNLQIVRKLHGVVAVKFEIPVFVSHIGVQCGGLQVEVPGVAEINVVEQHSVGERGVPRLCGNPVGKLQVCLTPRIGDSVDANLIARAPLRICQSTENGHARQMVLRGVGYGQPHPSARRKRRNRPCGTTHSTEVVLPRDGHEVDPVQFDRERGHPDPDFRLFR